MLNTNRFRLILIINLVVGVCLDIIFHTNFIKIIVVILNTIFIKWYEKKYHVRIAQSDDNIGKVLKWGFITGIGVVIIITIVDYFYKIF